MPWTIDKYNPAKPIDCVACWSGAFTDDEIEQIRFKAEVNTFNPGTTGASTVADNSVRNSDVFFIPGNEDNRWIYERLNNVIARANHEHFLYDINLMQDIQYTRYKPNGHYTWHWDHETSRYEPGIRKISLSMALNDPDSYEGGDFEIVTNGNISQPKSYRLKKGDIIMFASYMPHRVAPVISGVRESLVCWVMGPRDPR